MNHYKKLILPGLAAMIAASLSTPARALVVFLPVSPAQFLEYHKGSVPQVHSKIPHGYAVPAQPAHQGHVSGSSPGAYERDNLIPASASSGSPLCPLLPEAPVLEPRIQPSRITPSGVPEPAPSPEPNPVFVFVIGGVAIGARRLVSLRE